MMWQIPAKTFLLGEYAAIHGGSAIIVLTTPCFQLALNEVSHQRPFHPDSPAGKLWASYHANSSHLIWRDPYQGKGGLGASSAQFIGVYLAQCYLSQQTPCFDALLANYYQYAWSGEGLRPSGYDIIAQVSHQCVYINQQTSLTTCFDWPFRELSFVLVRSGEKLATHQHLQTLSLPTNTHALSAIVDRAKIAFEHADNDLLIEAINTYQSHLTELGLTATHSLEKINRLKKNKNILAIKGCGAMGADVLLLIFPRQGIEKEIAMLTAMGWNVLATERNLYKDAKLMKKNTIKA